MDRWIIRKQYLPGLGSLDFPMKKFHKSWIAKWGLWSLTEKKFAAAIATVIIRGGARNFEIVRGLIKKEGVSNIICFWKKLTLLLLGTTTTTNQMNSVFTFYDVYI